MTTYIEATGIKPSGTYYAFSQKEINKLVIDFVMKRTGFVLDLEVGCLDEIYDVYVSWKDQEEDLIDAFESFETSQVNKGTGYRPLYLSVEEDFTNRDTIFQEIFGTESIGYACEGYGEKTQYVITL